MKKGKGSESEKEILRRDGPTDQKSLSIAQKVDVNSHPGTPLDRFIRSMTIDFEKWHDGIGYDLEALGQLSPDERSTIEKTMISNNGRDWRDIEALAELNTPLTRKALREVFLNGDLRAKIYVIRDAPDIVSDDEKTEAIVHALQVGNLFGELSQTLDLVEEFHPPEVVEALLQGVQDREGEVAVNFAAMLLFIYGKAEQPFDWSQRPFLLRFNTDDLGERRKVFLEMCEIIGISSADHIIDVK